MNTDSPRSIVDAAGTRLATELDGFRWVKSRRRLVRELHPQRHEVVLQASSNSRTGHGTWVMPRVSVFDDRLAAWRQAHLSMSASEDAGSDWPCVYSYMLVNAEPRFASVDLSGLAQHHPEQLRFASSEALFTYLVSVALPILDASVEPASFAAALPSSWLPVIEAPLVEWAVSCGRPDVAGELIRRRAGTGALASQGLVDQFHRGWELADRGLRPAQQPAHGFEAIGWLARTHSLLGEDGLGGPGASTGRRRRFFRRR